MTVCVVWQLGEVWTELMDELTTEQIRPVTPDREALEAVSRTINDRAEHVCLVQKELLEAQHQQNILDEQEHYAEVRVQASEWYEYQQVLGPYLHAIQCIRFDVVVLRRFARITDRRRRRLKTSTTSCRERLTTRC